MVNTLILRKEAKMNKMVVEAPSGLKVSITTYHSDPGAIEIETNNGNYRWGMWFDHVDDVKFLAEVLHDFVEDRGWEQKGNDAEAQS